MGVHVRSCVPRGTYYLKRRVRRKQVLLLVWYPRDPFGQEVDVKALVGQVDADNPSDFRAQGRAAHEIVCGGLREGRCNVRELTKLTTRHKEPTIPDTSNSQLFSIISQSIVIDIRFYIIKTSDRSIEQPTRGHTCRRSHHLESTCRLEGKAGPEAQPRIVY